MLMPAYKPCMKAIRSAKINIRVWPDGASAVLQDCFDTTDWEMFKQIATYNGHTDIEKYPDTVTFIIKCMDDINGLMNILTDLKKKKTPSPGQTSNHGY